MENNRETAANRREYTRNKQEYPENGQDCAGNGQEYTRDEQDCAGNGREPVNNCQEHGALDQPSAPVMTMPRYKVLNRDAIKYIAVIAMTFNHIANAGFLPYRSTLYELFVNIGYITAITMCFFLVDGCHYTRSKKKYALRLFIFALLSQVPFHLAFGDNGLNMIYTLFLCFLILVVMEYVGPLILRIPLIVVLILLSDKGDWPLLIPLATVFFELSRGNRARQAASYAAMTLLLGLLEYRVNIRQYVFAEAPLHSLYAALPLLVSAVLTLGLYNGKQAERHRTFHRWFFYVYYPAHLLALVLIRRTLWGW